MAEKLIIAVVKHKTWGHVFVPYIVDFDAEKDFWHVLYRLNPSEYKTFKGVLTEEQRELLNTIYKYDDKVLLKAYSKKLNVNDFLNTVSDDVRDNVIIPFVQSCNRRCMELIIAIGDPVYYKTSEKVILRADIMKPVGDDVSVVFHVFKGEEATQYYLTLLYKDEMIALYAKDIVFLSEKSVIVKVDSCLFSLPEVNVKKILPFFTRKKIDVPKSKEKEWFSGFLAKTLINHDVHAEGFEVRPVDSDVKKLLTLECLLDGTPVAFLNFSYNDKMLTTQDVGDVRFVRFIDNEGEYVFELSKRDLDKEREVVELLGSLGMQSRDGGITWRFDCLEFENNNVYSFIELIGTIDESLKDCGIEIVNNLEKKYYIGTPQLQMQVFEDIDWFDVKAWVVFGDFKLPFINLKSHILRNQREFELPDGTIAILPKEWFSRYNDLFQFAVKHGDGIRVGKVHFGMLMDSMKKEKLDVASSYEELMQPIDASELALPEEIHAELRAYQKQGVAWMMRLNEFGFGGCLADDMGLGKTLQALVFLKHIVEKAPLTDTYSVPDFAGLQLSLFEEEQKPEQRRLPCLVVVPTSLVHNWASEMRKFVPTLRYMLYSGYNRKQSFSFLRGVDVIITSYGILRNDMELFARQEFELLVIDEAQYIKNPQSKTYKALMEMKARYRLALSGTPIENSLSDLWSQMNFLNKGILGSYNYFRNEYQLPIERREDLEKQEKLIRMISPFVLRRTKSEVAKDLPELSENVILCDMSEEQARLYDELKSKVRNSIIDTSLGAKDKGNKNINILKGLMQLRLLANHPRMLNMSEEIESGKFEEVKLCVEKVVSQGHKVLIYSSFVRHLKLFAKHFDDMGWRYLQLTGATGNREEVVLSFQNNSDYQLFLVSLKAGGVGLNLTAADYVFILDPWWNLAAELQAINRAHRIGREEKVMVYRFITADTIEEKIRNLQERKNKLSGVFINSGNFVSFVDEAEVLEMVE